jgi:hypothetical protein
LITPHEAQTAAAARTASQRLMTSRYHKLLRTVKSIRPALLLQELGAGLGRAQAD